jgi:hypothetical protein
MKAEEAEPAYKTATQNEAMFGQGYVTNGKAFAGSSEAIAHFKLSAHFSPSSSVTGAARYETKKERLMASQDPLSQTGDLRHVVKQHDGCYEGDLNGSGELDGKGLYRYSNGDEYDGLFKKGLKHGKGVFRQLVEEGDTESVTDAGVFSKEFDQKWSKGMLVAQRGRPQACVPEDLSDKRLSACN